MAEYGRIGQASDYGREYRDNEVKSTHRVPLSQGGFTTQTVQSPATGAVEVGEWVNVDVELKYDPKHDPTPWQYVLDFPLAMSQFFADLGYTTSHLKMYRGNSLHYETSEEAATEAETEARLLTNRYKKYADAHKKVTKYSLSIQMNKDNPVKDNDND